MAFTKPPLDKAVLSTNTLYRFAEIEMSQALPMLQKIGTFPQSLLDRLQEDFLTRDEQIIYLLYHNVSVRNICKILKTSPNTVVAQNDVVPDYTPVYPRWTQELFVQWNIQKKLYNLWNENLIHTKEET